MENTLLSRVKLSRELLEKTLQQYYKEVYDFEGTASIKYKKDGPVGTKISIDGSISYLGSEVEIQTMLEYKDLLAAVSY